MKYYIFISLLLIASCSTRNATFFDCKIIYGSWYLSTNQVNYPEIVLNPDSTTIVTSRGDTVYRYKIFVKKNILFLTDILGNETKAKIIKLNNDSLVFESLLANKEIQRYYRNRNNIPSRQ